MKVFKKSKLNDKYKLNIHYSDKDLIFLIDDIENEEIKLYKLKTTLENLKKKNEDFYLFQSTQKFIEIMSVCIESNNYSIELKKIIHLYWKFKMISLKIKVSK